jgi:DNA-binding CsgD family transcriptional regulator
MRETYFFCEKNTGVSHFHVEASADGQFPVEEAAGLLATHCMVRGQSPRDYVVMVEAAHEALEGLTDKAEKLLQAGHSVGSSVKLTRREEEVLGGVMRSLANKEIAASLNLSERTVKFHVSSLLMKFRVRRRMELVREATRRIPASVTGPQSFGSREARDYAAAPASYHIEPDATEVQKTFPEFWNPALALLGRELLICENVDVFCAESLAEFAKRSTPVL